MPEPLFVESAATAQSLLQQPTIAGVVAAARQVDVLLSGIGGIIHANCSGLFRTGYCNDNQLGECYAHEVSGGLLEHRRCWQRMVVMGDTCNTLGTRPRKTLRKPRCYVFPDACTDGK